jgi:hypothetical protein
MKKRIAFAGILLAGIIVAAVPAPAQFEHPELKSRKRVVKGAIILPPKVAVMKAGMKSNEPMIEEGRQVELALPGMIARVLEEFGCKVQESPFSAAALEKDAELKYALADMQTRFDAVLEQLKKKPKDVRKGRFTLGDEVLKVNPGGADTLIFVRATGFLSTGGKKVFSAMIGGPGLIQMVQVNVTIVDGQNGTVLYFARSLATGNFVQETEKMAKPIRGSFKNFAKAAGKKV